jgi:hypothetical protein
VSEKPCEGPLIWFPCGNVEADDCGAVLECGRPECDYVIVTGNFHHPSHADAPLVMEGLAS